jgi:hypothetical protein
MDWSGWATFGFGATVALTAILVAAQLTGRSRMDLPMLLGTMFVEDPDRARVVGSFIHLLNGQVFALFYAGAFGALGESEWWIGGLFGLGHGVAVLILVFPLIAGIHPRMATTRGGPQLSALESPGFLGLNYGAATPVVTVLAHIIYGVILGSFLSPG